MYFLLEKMDFHCYVTLPEGSVPIIRITGSVPFALIFFSQPSRPLSCNTLIRHPLKMESSWAHSVAQSFVRFVYPETGEGGRTTFF